MLSIAPSLLDLQAASDSGLYDDDNLTNVTTPIIDITAAEAGDVIRVYREGVLLGEGTQIDGTLYQYGFAADVLVEGDNPITARSFDGIEESEDSPYLVIALDTTALIVTEHLPSGGTTLPVDFLDVTFSEPIDSESLTLGELNLSGPEGLIALSSVEYLSGNTFRISLPEQTVDGAYTLQVSQDVCDLAGNLMDQDADGQPGEDPDDIYDGDFTLAIGPRIIADGPDVPVDLRTETLDSVTVTFNEVIDFDPGGTGNFWFDDVTIIGPAGMIAPTGITSLGSNEYEISFNPQRGLASLGRNQRKKVSSQFGMIGSLFVNTLLFTTKAKIP